MSPLISRHDAGLRHQGAHAPARQCDHKLNHADLGNTPIRFNSSGDNACNIVLRRAIWAELRMLFRLEECQEFPFQVLGKSDPNDLLGP